MVFNPALGNWWWQPQTVSLKALQVFPGVKISSVIYSLGHRQFVKALFESAGVKGKFRVSCKWQTGIHEAGTISVLSTTASLIPSYKPALNMHLLQ